jgi:hypothetical protein
MQSVTEVVPIKVDVAAVQDEELPPLLLGHTLLRSEESVGALFAGPANDDDTAGIEDHPELVERDRAFGLEIANRRESFLQLRLED